MTIRAITFDIHNTIVQKLDPVRSHVDRRRAIRRFCISKGHAVTQHEVEVSYREVETLMEKCFSACVHYPVKSALKLVLLGLSVPVDDAELRALSDQLDEIETRFTFTPVPGIIELLSEIRGSYQIGIISNLGWETGAAVRAKLHRCGLSEYFNRSGLVFSDEIGFYKPDVRPFLRCARQLEVAPSECIHIGDSWGADILGADRAGYGSAIWFTPVETTRRRYAGSVDCASELLVAIEKGATARSSTIEMGN